MNKDNFIVYQGSSLKDALKQIDKNENGFVVVCDKSNKAIGIATDGDIRRAILNKFTLKMISAF